MHKYLVGLASAAGLLLLGSAAPPPAERDALPLPAEEAVPPVPAPPPAMAELAAPAPAEAVDAAFPDEPLEPAPPPVPAPPAAEELLQDGVLIVVSIPSQRMFVLKDGSVWGTTRVSTGKRGHDTPLGTFPILQKKVHHRSNLYDDAPMPYMQRLTWGGVALHAGHVPGYPASHGCIRMPKAFAKKLYGITDFSRTLVAVTDEPLITAKDAASSVGVEPSEVG